MGMRKGLRETWSYKIEMVGMLAAPVAGAALGWLYGAPTLDIPERVGTARAAELGAVMYGFVLVLPLMLVGAIVGMALDARSGRRHPKAGGKPPRAGGPPGAGGKPPRDGWNLDWSGRAASRLGAVGSEGPWRHVHRGA